MSTELEITNGPINKTVTQSLEISTGSGPLAFSSMDQVMEFAKLMAIGKVAVPAFLRANPGACLAVAVQALEWGMSPFAVANKAYSVNDRLAYESQMLNAVILKRAPIKGRFQVDYTGDGATRKCTVSAILNDDDSTVVSYTSPAIGQITTKNSPLWKSDPDQQLFYFASRSLCRRHFPDVLLGVYAREEVIENPRERIVTAKVEPIAGMTAPTEAEYSQEINLDDAPDVEWEEAK